MRVAAYKYDADIHCIPCAEARFGEFELLVNQRATDREGNPVYPVFSTEMEGHCTEHCGTCRKPICY